jgi:hypothetical protein
MALSGKSDDEYEAPGDEEYVVEPPVIAPKKRIEFTPKKKADPAASFMPSLFRSLLGAVAALNKKVDANAAAQAQPPKIIVEAPTVKVEAPDVTVQTPKTPTEWRCRITERDEYGRILELTIKAAK